MPLTLASLISRRVNRFPSRSSTRTKQKLYFAPGGHTHDRHTIPPDRLFISLSDPVLVAAEENLANALPNDRNELSTIEKSRDTANLGSTVLHLHRDVRSQDDNGNPVRVPATVDDSTVTTRTSPDYSPIAKFQGDVSGANDSCDISETTIVSVIDGSPGNTNSSASENSRDAPDLYPLASETFKEELYVRGYLKRPASRPANVVLRTPRNNLMLMSRRVFPKVLGRCQGRKVAACLRAEQDADINPGGPNALLSESPLSTVDSVTRRTPHTNSLESPGMDTNTSASESFDLHEFSYITAFTTPPSSPSIILDAETSNKGAFIGDSKRAVYRGAAP